MVDMQTTDSGLYVCQIATHPPVGLHTIVRVRGKQVALIHKGIMEKKSYKLILLFLCLKALIL